MPDDETVRKLKGAMRGEVITAVDEEYEVASRVWNRMIHKRPELVIRYTGAADVIAAVKFAREHDGPLCTSGFL